MKRIFLGLLTFLTFLSFSRELELTVYNQNFGLVKDIRVMELKEGESIVKVNDVAALIDPATVHFKSLTAPEAVIIREQNYEFDLINPEKLLSKYIGKNIRVRQHIDGKEKLIEGTLLSTAGGTVIQTKDGIVLNPSGQIELPALPEGLVSKPELVWNIICQKGGKHTIELSYITQGLNWKADYVVVVNQNDDVADLTGWVTLTNTSGTSYENATLKLIAGDVRRVTPQLGYGGYGGIEATKAAMAPAAGFEEQAFFEYHLYTLRYPTTIKENETKQISFVEAPQIKVKKVFVFDTPLYQMFWWALPSPPSTKEEKVKVKIEIENKKENNLGIPLPKGIVRVYKADQDGSLQFIGEDQIDHTPKDEKLRLYIGDAFDIKGERKRIDYKKISDDIYEYEMEIYLRNHKDQDVEIIDIEKLPGDWEILKSNYPYEKTDSQTIEYKLTVPANGEVKINYRARVK
ncbi:hypothetical protein H5T87_08655 [bacterium]|nr:hypothetical protein [bacterium]